ncbi:MAG: hypothetical protein HZB21_01395 [Deltaproteobacteria bacterium]|nr:hypothetical protein [Deltaproteobacteria bacterium]
MYAGLLTVWAAAGLPLFVAEASSVMDILASFGRGMDEREFKDDRPIYNLSKNVISKIPHEARVFFFVPPEWGEFYSGRLKYYLYPRRFIPVDAKAEEPARDIKGGDYVLLYVPGNFSYADFKSSLSRLIPLEDIYEHADDYGWQAIFRVRKGGT